MRADLVFFFSAARALIFFSRMALADVASDDLIRRPRRRLCPAGSGGSGFGRSSKGDDVR